MERSGMRERLPPDSLRSIRAGTRVAANSMSDTISPEISASARKIALAFDLRKLDPKFLDDPYPVYRALREHDPIHRMPNGSYFLSRYDDCAEVYRDPACWSSDKKIDFRPNFADSLLYEHYTTSLVFNDPPYHTRVRKLLAPAFTPRALKALQPRIETLVDRLLDRAAERGSFDLIDDFAAAIPVQLIGDMLGVPSEERGPLRGWSLAILGALEPVLTKQQFERGVAAVAEFKAYLTDLIGRRIHEQHGHEGEILSTLIAASDVVAANVAQDG
jgi:cytochrome P450